MLKFAQNQKYLESKPGKNIAERDYYTILYDFNIPNTAYIYILESPLNPPETFHLS